MFFGLLLTFLRTLYGFLRTKSCCFRTVLVFSELVPELFMVVSEPVSELFWFSPNNLCLFPNFSYFSHNWVVLLQNLPITTITCSTLSLDFTQLLQLLNMIGNSIFCNMAFCSKFLAGNLWVIFYE